MLTIEEHSILENKCRELNAARQFTAEPMGRVSRASSHCWRTKKIHPEHYDRSCRPIGKLRIGKEYIILVEFDNGEKAWGKRSWVKGTIFRPLVGCW